jgi:hypothetical protein
LVAYKRHSLLIVIAAILWTWSTAFGEIFRVIEDEFLWMSPNVTTLDVREKPVRQNTREPGFDLSMGSFRGYFDRHGMYPSLSFLSPLIAETLPVADIREGSIFFWKTGKKIPLNVSCVPTWATPVPPYLLRTPDMRWVVAVYPYYAYQEKENRYVSEIYTSGGDLVLVHPSLPTHVSHDNSKLLVASERTGCCESLKWSIRFYDLVRKTVSEISCPEGYCGDLLFTKLGAKGPFFIAQEIVGRVGEIGASMQTNFAVIENDGRLSASGKTLYALRALNLSAPRAQSLSPYAISKLRSVRSLPGNEGWMIQFGDEGGSASLKIGKPFTDPSPSVVFLLPKDPARTPGKGRVKVGDQFVGTLPLFGVSDPGQIHFEISHEDGSRETVFKETTSDSVNILMY